MRIKSVQLGFEVLPNLDDGRCRRWYHRRPARQGEVRGRVIQLPCLVGTDALAELVGIAVASSRPVEGECGEDGSHRVIRVAGHSALRSEREHHLGTKLADLKNQLASHLVSL